MARKTKEYDESVTVSRIEKKSVVYSSIEEASKVTGLSVASIKLRCNKCNSVPKDGIVCEWTNPTTKRAKQAKKSKNKGRDWEYEIVKNLKAIGYKNVCTSAGESKKLDAKKVDIADPSGELEVAVQAKHMGVFPNFFKIRKECTDPRDFVLLWKKSAEGGTISMGQVAIMDVEFFYKLLKCYHNK